MVGWLVGGWENVRATRSEATRMAARQRTAWSLPVMHPLAQSSGATTLIGWIRGSTKNILRTYLFYYFITARLWNLRTRICERDPNYYQYISQGPFSTIKSLFMHSINNRQIVPCKEDTARANHLPLWEVMSPTHSPGDVTLGTPFSPGRIYSNPKKKYVRCRQR
jgi:hypothetical protein